MIPPPLTAEFDKRGSSLKEVQESSQGSFCPRTQQSSIQSVQVLPSFHLLWKVLRVSLVGEGLLSSGDMQKVNVSPRRRT